MQVRPLPAPCYEEGAVKRKLKVYCTNWNGMESRMVAAASQKEAARLFKRSLYDMRNYCSVTSNAAEIALAMQEPGVVWRCEYRHDAVWERA